MKIYEHETNAGLAEKISNNNSIAFTCDIKSEPQFSLDRAIAKIKGNPNQKDLFYIESVLVSTNWNGNDDVFVKDQVWAARSTPVDKQFNFMHQESDIIGHITSAHVVDMEGKEVSSDLSIDEVPDFFDIVVGSVLYKRWSDPERQERMNRIIEEIQANKKFVSMEALFTDFDYAAIAEDGSTKVIQRNEKTSFLTKALRIYGGSGEYEGYKIGRLIKNITFSGKGLVDNPANKRSHIKSYSFSGTQATQKEFRSELMDTVSKAEYDAQQTRLDEVKADLEKARSEVEALKNEKSTLAKELENEKQELENEKALSTQRSEKIEELENVAKQDKEKMKKEKEEKEKLKADLVKRDRVAKLLSAGVKAEKADELAEKFASATDEMFGEVVALQTKVADNTQAEVTEEEKEKLEAEKAAKAKAELETAEEEENASASSFTDNDELLHTAASEWFDKELNNQ